MTFGINNPGGFPPGLNTATGNGDARYGVDARALGKSLPTEQPSFDGRFANGAQRHFDGQKPLRGHGECGEPLCQFGRPPAGRPN